MNAELQEKMDTFFKELDDLVECAGETITKSDLEQIVASFKYVVEGQRDLIKALEERCETLQTLMKKQD